MAVGFYLDMKRCTGCRACQVACKDKNRLDVGTVYRNAHSYSVGSFPLVTGYSYSATCNHCEDPACVANCPTGAMYKAEDGSVLHDDETCIGCKTCMSACPYGVPKYLEEKDIVGKCDTCYLIREAGGKPACVAGCPSRAIDFGDVDELKEKYGSDLVNQIAILPSAEETNPNVLINAKHNAVSSDYIEVAW